MPLPASGRLKARTATPSLMSSAIVMGASTVGGSSVRRGLRAALAVLAVLTAGGLQLLVAGLEQAARVVLFGDVAAEQLARTDVDRVVAEHGVEVGEDAVIEVAESERFELLDVGAIRGSDRHLLVELRIVLVLELESE